MPLGLTSIIPKAVVASILQSDDTQDTLKRGMLLGQEKIHTTFADMKSSMSGIGLGLAPKSDATISRDINDAFLELNDVLQSVSSKLKSESPLPSASTKIETEGTIHEKSLGIPSLASLKTLLFSDELQDLSKEYAATLKEGDAHAKAEKLIELRDKVIETVERTRPSTALTLIDSDKNLITSNIEMLFKTQQSTATISDQKKIVDTVSACLSQLEKVVPPNMQKPLQMIQKGLTILSTSQSIDIVTENAALMNHDISTLIDHIHSVASDSVKMVKEGVSLVGLNSSLLSGTLKFSEQALRPLSAFNTFEKTEKSLDRINELSETLKTTPEGDLSKTQGELASEYIVAGIRIASALTPLGSPAAPVVKFLESKLTTDDAKQYIATTISNEIDHPSIDYQELGRMMHATPEGIELKASYDTLG
jgi:hypothetical protein